MKASEDWLLKFGAAFLRPNGIQNKPKGVFEDITRLHRNLVVCPDQINLEEDSGAGECSGEILNVWDRASARDHATARWSHMGASLLVSSSEPCEVVRPVASSGLYYAQLLDAGPRQQAWADTEGRAISI